jgi:hypothetical protein
MLTRQLWLAVSLSARNRVATNRDPAASALDRGSHPGSDSLICIKGVFEKEASFPAGDPAPDSQVIIYHGHRSFPDRMTASAAVFRSSPCHVGSSPAPIGMSF